jgi:Tol biopolymer transport system component
MRDKKPSKLSRRDLLALSGGTILAPLPASTASAQGTAPTSIPPRAGTGAKRRVQILEGTNLAAAASADGSRIAFDLAASLWVVGIEGGTAQRLTDDLGDIAQPDWSPDGQNIVFQSYREGNFQLWLVSAKGGPPRRLTEGPFDCREPRFSPDGTKIAFSSDRSGSYGIHVFELATGAITPMADTAAEECEPSWSPDGSKIVFATDKSKIEIIDDKGQRSTIAAIDSSRDIMLPKELHAPSFTPDGSDVIYSVIANGKAELWRSGQVLVTGEDVFPFRVTFLPNGDFIYSSSGKIRRRALDGTQGLPVEFNAELEVIEPAYRKRERHFESAKPRPVIGIGSPVLSPDGKHIAFRAVNDLWTLTIGQKPVPLTRDGFYKSDPAWSPDGKQILYSSDRGGKLDLWLRDLASGSDRQMTHGDHAAVSGTFAPDGQQAAYLDQNGNLYTVSIADGAAKKLLGPLWEPGRPSFSPDGKTIALAAFKPYSGRYREGLSEILTVDAATGAANYYPALAHRSLSTRGDDGPAWSPDGTALAFVLGSLLWVLPVDAKGQPTGPGRAINAEVTDAPSWSGDSQSLLYLSNGKLRLIRRQGGTPKTIPLDLTWASPRVRTRTIILAARLWDGRSPNLRQDAEVIIEGNRIAGIVPSGMASKDKDARIIDARDKTVIPGLMDMHTHRQMQGYSYGDRQGRLWLSLGITTTRSVGSPAYHMVEDREAIESGARLAPRHFATGEAIDGSRIFYNFMRPVTEPGQMELELQRAEALGYDLVKTYVRLAPDKQKAVIDWAHQRGLHVTSHYHYPAGAFGVDGVEHLGATSRFGYSRTISALGAAYQDVLSLFDRGRTYRTPTLFAATALLGNDQTWIDDPRIKALYPAWEYARLVERAKQMSGPAQAIVLQTLERSVVQIRESIRNGGRIISGTDAPIDFVAISLHLNLRAMVRFGLSPYEALLTATSIPAEFLGQPIGAIEPGALADLVVVDGNPLANIEDAAKVRHVIYNGNAYSIDDLIGPFGSTPAKSERRAALIQKAPPAHNKQYWWHSAAYVEGSRHACCQATAIASRGEDGADHEHHQHDHLV